MITGNAMVLQTTQISVSLFEDDDTQRSLVPLYDSVTRIQATAQQSGIPVGIILAHRDISFAVNERGARSNHSAIVEMVFYLDSQGQSLCHLITDTPTRQVLLHMIKSVLLSEIGWHDSRVSWIETLQMSFPHGIIVGKSRLVLSRSDGMSPVHVDLDLHCGKNIIGHWPACTPPVVAQDPFSAVKKHSPFGRNDPIYSIGAQHVT